MNTLSTEKQIIPIEQWDEPKSGMTFRKLWKYVTCIDKYPMSFRPNGWNLPWFELIWNFTKMEKRIKWTHDFAVFNTFDLDANEIIESFNAWTIQLPQINRSVLLTNFIGKPTRIWKRCTDLSLFGLSYTSFVERSIQVYNIRVAEKDIIVDWKNIIKRLEKIIMHKMLEFLSCGNSRFLVYYGLFSVCTLIDWKRLLFVFKKLIMQFNSCYSPYWEYIRNFYIFKI